MSNVLQPELIRFFSDGTGMWVAFAAGISAMAAWLWTNSAPAPVPVPVRRRRNTRR